MSLYPQRTMTYDEDNNRLNRGNFLLNTVIVGLTCYIAWVNTRNYEINLKTLIQNTKNTGNTNNMVKELQKINQKLSERSI